MKKKCRIFETLLLVPCLLFVTCTIDSTKSGSPSSTHLGGSFSLVSLQDSSRSVRRDGANQRGTLPVDFDLGLLKASHEFFFILQNTGDNPISSISLEASDGYCQVTPSRISLLKPIGESPVIPLISVGIEHGVVLNGVGFTGVRTPGVNTFTITVKGITESTNGEPGEVTSTFSFQFNAALADLELSDGTTEVHLPDDKSGSAGSSYDIQGLGDVFIYKAKNPILTNSGNVVLDLYLARYDENAMKYIELSLGELAPGMKKELADTMDSGNFLRINSKNTIFDPFKFQIGSRGDSFIFIDRS